MSVWGRRGFTPLVSSATVSEVGSQVSVLVLPVIAATVLTATPWQMGVLAAAGTAAFLVIGLPAGALVDRWRPRRVMVVCDLVRALLLVTVPLAFLGGGLSFAQLVAVAFAVGVATVFGDVAAQSILPALVARDDLVRANSVLMTGTTAAEVAGPGLGGLLLRVVSAPAALLADVVSFLASALLLLRVPAPARPERTEDRALGAEIVAGLRYVLGRPILRRITLCTATVNLAGGLRDAVLVLFALRDLALSPSLLGLVLSVGAAGGVVGAVAAGPLAGLVGQARIVPVGALALLPFTALTAVAGAAPAVLLVISAAGIGAATVVYNVAQLSMRQRACPPELLGRMNASIRTVVWGSPPLGALAGGALAGVVGNVAVLWGAVVLTALGSLPVLLSPLRRDEVPDP
ncbi:MFS transporter [Actinomycetospora termitidis]|uniref:MFS transporter n=1 Tax=Actinomycetospora termitidis TaxID=3053470 RepID=A0ABT7MDA7_9PSEU|nr:MFS transporter [Actinomycetospora sp. Odt1-22]MDL5157363.1 MFS transporter [Actinomycetospora sp. Odt1-22]